MVILHTTTTTNCLAHLEGGAPTHTLTGPHPAPLMTKPCPENSPASHQAPGIERKRVIE